MFFEFPWISGHEKDILRWTCSLIAEETVGHQNSIHVLCRLFGTGNESDVVTHHVGQDSCQERVVGAAKNQGVDTRRLLRR